MFEDRPFTHAGENYVVRLQKNGEMTTARLFKNGAPASPYSYSVSFEVASSMRSNGHVHAVDAIIQEAKGDLTEEARSRVTDLFQSLGGARHLSAQQEQRPTGGYGSIHHRDEFDKPISEETYRKFLEYIGYHGYHPAGYGPMTIKPGDGAGRIWLCEHSASCD